MTEECRREEFDCGIEALNEYLRRFAQQNHERNIARTFVAVDAGNRIWGYYSLSSASIEFEALPPEAVRRLPKYPVPAVRLARLAVDRGMRGSGLGGRLLVDALRRALSVSAEIGIKVVLVDAKNREARGFYRHYGFLELRDQSMKLFLPIETVRAVLA